MIHMKSPVLLATLMLALVLAALPSTVFASSVSQAGSQLVKFAGNPILGPTPGSWDSDYTLSPRVLFDGTVYRMWYNGGRSGTTAIGFATSNDGFSWTKQGPILGEGKQGTWDSAVVQLGGVFWNSTLFIMWYRGSNSTTNNSGAIGLATSQDGASWTKYSGNPVLNPTLFGADQKYMASPYAFKYAQTYSMWYTGGTTSSSPTTSILQASSYDGINWMKAPSPALTPSTDANAWDSGSLYSPSVIYDGTNFELWYSALDKTFTTPRIGFATSPDQMTWTRSSSNPVLTQGPAGSWDSAGVEQPSVILNSNGYMVYYDGIGQYSSAQIGVATGPSSIALPEFPGPTLIMGLAIIAAFGLIRYRKTHTKQGN